MKKWKCRLGEIQFQLNTRCLVGQHSPRKEFSFMSGWLTRAEIRRFLPFVDMGTSLLLCLCLVSVLLSGQDYLKQGALLLCHYCQTHNCDSEIILRWRFKFRQECFVKHPPKYTLLFRCRETGAQRKSEVEFGPVRDNKEGRYLFTNFS